MRPTHCLVSKLAADSNHVLSASPVSSLFSLAEGCLLKHQGFFGRPQPQNHVPPVLWVPDATRFHYNWRLPSQILAFVFYGYPYCSVYPLDGRSLYWGKSLCCTKTYEYANMFAHRGILIFTNSRGGRLNEREGVQLTLVLLRFDGQ